MTKTATSIRIARSETVLRKVRASPWSRPCTPGGSNSLGRLFDVLRCGADGIPRLQVEEHCDAGELIDVVDGLRTDDRDASL